MKWIRINGRHINTDQLQMFRWEKGYLILWFTDDPEGVNWWDPEQELYLQLCHTLGVMPWEGAQCCDD